MNRSTAREIAVHFAFELAFSDERAEALLARELTPEAFALRGREEPIYAQFPGEGELDYITRLVRGVGGHGAELDGYIDKYAKGWKFSRIDRVASAIMRVAMYEILYMPDVPDKAAINEAVEIAKKYVDDDVVKFINGILGSFVRTELPEQG
ncbi:MAG: transcription antitermination factor NusB [Oscillospiraceae bacterium]|jgi:N utilization substance protein B|nr:transcription antitermination factor NusB [Oscillospiraceae bacterium]MCI9289107.1 transcription antitermination factor NusB [Oscillospiraceae bacterium]